MNNQNLPNYVKLFGNIDFSRADKSRSVYSPSAYLADLLQLIDDQFDNSSGLDQRRADIRTLTLDAENTFTLLPYLNIVNEILEQKVTSDSKQNDLVQDAYDILRNANYPFNLPFSLERDRIALYEKYLGITPEEFHKAFSKAYKKDIVAREYLGLSEEEATIVVTESIEDRLEEQYGSLLPGLGKTLKIVPVNMFVDITGLTHIELRELLMGHLDTNEREEERQSTFFCNSSLNGFARYDELEENIVWSVNARETVIPGKWFDRAQRLIRLSRMTDLSISDLDLIIRDCCDNNLNQESLEKIAIIKKLSTAFALKIDEMCALLSAMNDMGHGDEDFPTDLFNRVFNGSFASLGKTYIGVNSSKPTQFHEFTQLKYNGDILALDNKVYRNRIAQGLNISEKHLQVAIRGFRSRANEDIEDEDNHDSLWTSLTEEMSMLSTLYRTSKLTQVLDTSFEDLFRLLDSLERDPIVRQLTNTSVFIDYNITDKNCYKILRQGSAEELLWLVQLLHSLTQWLMDNGLTAEELLKISTGRHRCNLKEAIDLNDEKESSAEVMAKKEKIALLNNVYGQLKPSLLDTASFVSNTFDSRFSRIIHNGVMNSALAVKADKRLVHTHEKVLMEVALDAIERVELITQADFLGLGLEEKIADKIFANLTLMGYLSTEGMLDGAMLPESASSFSLETDFTDIKEDLFEIIQALNDENVDAAIYPSDFESLELSKAHLDELYDNLIFNGFLSEDGTLLQGSTFDSIDNLDLFEIHAGIDEYTSEVHTLLSTAIEKFKQTKIAINKSIFADLPLAELELDDLVENLRFNEYIHEENVLADHIAVLQVKAEDLLLELRFYPHRHKILAALKTHIEQHKNQVYTFKKEQFFDIADQLVADWAFEAIASEYLQDDRILEQERDYFKNLENAPTLDIAWPFEATHNRVVFERVCSIIQTADQYRLTNTPFEAFKFERSEIDELVDILIFTGYLTEEYQIPADKLPYFLNINNALEFTVQAFEDYNKDIFFLLHAIAKQVDQSAKEIITLHKKLVAEQDSALYQSLQDVFGIPADSIAAIANQVFAGADNVRDEWLVPILATVNIHDEIDREPDSSRFNTAYRRIQQFALLAAKLKLDSDEIDIAFQDQNLTEKYPESIELPEVSNEQITSFDAFLESTDGRIYLFKSADTAIDNDYARYWAYSSITHELLETEDNKVSTLLTGDKVNTVSISRIDAAFVNKQGKDVLIADGRYYVKENAAKEKDGKEQTARENAEDGGVWQIEERDWGQVDHDFEDLQVIDAAFTDESGYTYLFSNDEYVRYSNGIANVDDGYPKNIMDSWKDEGRNHMLPEEFQSSLDAAFHGIDNKTYLFKDGQFVGTHDPDNIQSTRGMWGKVKNNLKMTQQVDAFYGDGSQYFALSGDQVFAYRDCLENEDVMVQEGFPKLLIDHFGPSLPGEFHAGVDAVFKGEDGQIHLFKGEKWVAINKAHTNQSETDTNQSENVVFTKDQWGRIGNTLATDGRVDAALTGLDGRIYVFSGDQYFRYSSSDYSEVDSGYPRDVSEDWGGLTAINAAFVRDGKTYVFGTGEVEQADGTKTGQKAYVRYSTNDYEQPDDGYPKQQVETDDSWWNLPEALTSDRTFEQVNAVFNAPDGKTFLFSDNEFIYFDRGQNWWSEPRPISAMWEGVTAVDAVFSGKDGKTYFFSGDEYFRFSGDDYCHLDNGYPRTTNRLWGNVKNNIAEYGKVDAALVVESREEEEQEDGTTETVKTMHTYLFSGDQFFRYEGNKYSHVEPGYPKAIGLLKDEPRFKDIDMMFDEGIDAAFSDRRNVYLLKGSTFHIVSDEPCAKYPDSEGTAPINVDCAFMDQGAVYLESNNPEVGGWQHISSLEGRDIVLTPELPPLLVDVDIPSDYRLGLDAVLQGTDTNTYLFKGNAFFNQGLNREFPISDQWGRVRNNIQDRNTIDAGFVGRDGKTYVFSGDQYVVYDTLVYSSDIGLTMEVFQESEQTSAVKAIADDWGGLTSVHVAYVMEEYTYLFEKPDYDGNFRYVRYSSTDYEQPDPGFPKVADADFWDIPAEYQAQGWDTFDAIEFENNDTLLFIKGKEFLQFNVASSHWFQPKSLDTLWDGIHQDHELFENLQAAFMGADGTAYFFGDECYIAHTNGKFTERKPISDDWGILPNEFKDRVDAAFIYQGAVTYLFAGDQYIRYSSNDYSHIDDGYPKSITQDLRQESGFENLPRDFEGQAGALNSGDNATIINAVVANNRHIYVFIGNNCYVSSNSKTYTCGIKNLGHRRNQLAETGDVDAAFVTTDGKTYLFSGDQYVRYSKSNYDYVDNGYPKRIATGLANDLATETVGSIPMEFYSGIDAALIDRKENENDVVYLFKDNKYLGPETNTSKAIKDTWGKTTNNFDTTANNEAPPIDGAFVDAMGRLYAFKGDQFIRYVDTEQYYVETGYPKRINSTFEVPDSFVSGIDGAFTFEGGTYLIKGDQYVRYLSDDYGCLPSFYPVNFMDRWGDWSDYRLEDIRLITRFKSLQDSYSGEYTLADLLKGYVKHPYALLADIFNWDIEEVKWLKRNNAFLPAAAKEETQFNLELICRMFDILSLTDKMATGAKSAYEDIWLKRYGTEANLTEAADALLELLGIKNGNSPDWQVLVDEVHNKLNLLKRDALVPYTIFKDPEIEDARDLYEPLLIDVQMGETAQISRIKEAISAVQLYFHRYFINLEDITLKSSENGGIQKEDLKERWQWMRNYRVWEANRKVFLYPENYIRPELRDTKTPEFQTLENDLLQGELTEETITRAFNHYIDRYIEVSRLTIAGGYVYDSVETEGDKDIILFGRTKSEPHQYYYRMATFVEGQSDSVMWKPWIEVNVQIDADHVYPVFALNKIFVFWAKVEIRSNVGADTKVSLKGDMSSGFESESDVVNESVLQVYYSYFNLNKQWAPPQKIHYDITSDDTIVDFFLTFNGLKEKATTDLDNIKVSCHYTTEQQIKPQLNSGSGEHLSSNDVSTYFAEKQVKLLAPQQNGTSAAAGNVQKTDNDDASTATVNVQKTEDKTAPVDPERYEDVEVKISLKTSNLPKPHYLNAWEARQADGQVTIQFIPPGKRLSAGMTFKVVPESGHAPDSKTPARVAFESVTPPNHYLYCDTTSGNVYLKELNGQTSQGTDTQERFFLITKGQKGDGYSLQLASTSDRFLTYSENGTSEIVVQQKQKGDDSEASTKLTQATFSFITRKEEGNTFHFYPETNNANKLTQKELVPISAIGIDLFEELFPQEDVTQIGRPVLLNVPVGQQLLPWVCYDYKGGSFLCKPTSGQTEQEQPGDLKDLVNLDQLPANFTLVSATLHVNDKAYLFSNEGGQESEFLIESGSATKTTDIWGVVRNNIQADGEIDAALVRDGKTFLFRGDQYVVYTHKADGGYDDYVDESYPRLLTGNTDGLPDIDKWEHIDAACQIGETSYFFNGSEYVTSSDLINPKKISELWPSEQLSDIRGVLRYEGEVHAFNHHKELLFADISSETLKARLNTLYTQTNSSGIDLEKVIAAFAIDNVVYLTIENKSVVEYIRYEGGSSSLVFKDLNNAQYMKAVFVQGDYFYILQDPGNNINPSIVRWKKDAKDDSQKVEIKISNAPGKDVDHIFYDSHNQKTYLFLSIRETGQDSLEYMVLDGLPGDKPGTIRWKKEGSIDEYLASLKKASRISRIDAGFNKDAQVFLLSGDRYLRFSGQNLAEPDPGYPKLLKEAGDNDGLPSWDNLDAAFQQESKAGSTVWFFRGTGYSNSELLSANPEQALSLTKNKWGKVRNNIQSTGRVDAAFTIDDWTYLISGDQYYRYAMSELIVPLPKAGYPLEIGYPKKLANNSDRLPEWFGRVLEQGGKIFEQDDNIVGILLDDGHESSNRKYQEVDTRTGVSSSGLVSQKWQLPEGFKDFDAAYYNKTDSHLYLIAGQKYIKYQNPPYDIIRLSSMTGSQLSQILFIDGIDGLMRRSNQEIDELPTFTLNQAPAKSSTEDAIIRVAPEKVSHIHFPVNSHLEFRGANGVYYWELFYHAPALIAQSLNTAQKFEKAKQWYEYIFDPTESDDYWKFLPFRAVDIDALIAIIAPWKTSDDDITSAAAKLIAKLMPFASALSGQASMDEDEAAMFNSLGKWDDQGNLTTWQEVTDFEDYIDSLAATDDEGTLANITTAQETIALIKRLPIRYALMTKNGLEQIKTYLDDPFDPHAIARLRRIVYRRTTVMAYIDNLLDWGDMLFGQYTHESINEARMLYILAYDLLGKKPSSLGTRVLSEEVAYEALHDTRAEADGNAYDFLFDISDDQREERSLTHAGVVHENVGNPYFYIPENEQILKYWDRVEDRLYKIRHSLNILGEKQPLPLFQPPIDPMALVRAVAGGGGLSAALAGQMVTVPHYRFTFMLNKARELVGKLGQFGNELLGTIEKKDAEELSLLQSRQESVILQMTREIREAQLREAQENLKSLEISKESIEYQKTHYDDLLKDGLIPAEKAQIGLMSVASLMFLLIPFLKLGAAVANVAPDVKVGAPTTVGAETGGSTVGASLGFIAESIESVAEGISMVGEVAGIVAQYQRTRQDWELQQEMAKKELEQLEHQITGAKLQIQVAEKELAVHDKEIEHHESITTFMREKFSNLQLYQWMEGKLSALYFQTYKMAHDIAKSAEKAYSFERGVPESQVSFISGTYWDSLRRGLLASEQLDFDLDRMEKAYLETHTRDFEITKTISLIELDPMAYLDLKSKGVCEFQFTEALFDYDFPGHYCRQIKTVAVKLNAGQGRTVNAMLTQLRHKTVMEPDPKAVKYLMDMKDTPPLSIRSDWRPNQQIAVSEVDQYSETSSGVFELNFGDERYLPFEGTGAVSSWRLELGGKRGSYDINALADAEIEVKYTARQGGQVFADAVKGMLKPYDAAVLFDMAKMFPNEFFAFVYGETEELEISVTRDMFPNMAGQKLTAIYSVFEMGEEANVTIVMNEDPALTLRNNGLLLINSLMVARTGVNWRFKAKGGTENLANMRLVLSYKARIN
ncbi:MAG: hemopexin repeat-containing protein [Cyanobacteria bacterium P01_F01_bin.150]